MREPALAVPRARGGKDTASEVERPAERPEAEGKFQVLHDAEVGKTAGALEVVSTNELALVAEGDTEHACPEVIEQVQGPH